MLYLREAHQGKGKFNTPEDKINPFVEVGRNIVGFKGSSVDPNELFRCWCPWRKFHIIHLFVTHLQTAQVKVCKIKFNGLNDTSLSTYTCEPPRWYEKTA